jgi:hypothetical protein
MFQHWQSFHFGIKEDNIVHIVVTCSCSLQRPHKMSTENFTFVWKEFPQNTATTLFQSLSDEIFSDVTLACDDEEIKAHKLILSSNSLVFRNILQKNTDRRPIIYLRGVKIEELRLIINFIYQGEISVPKYLVKNFLALAEDLKVLGLSEISNVGIQDNESKYFISLVKIL